MLTDPDPYLAFLIRRQFPFARVEADSTAVLSEPGAPDVVILGVDDAEACGANHGGTAVIGIVDGESVTSPRDLDGVLARPFLPGEVRRVVGRALGMSDASGAAPSVRTGRAGLAMDVARMAAVALAAVLDLASVGRVPPTRALILALAFTYSTARLIVARQGRFGAWIDIAAGVTVILLTGGLESNYAPFGLVVAISAGMTLGPRAGAFAGMLVAASGSVSIAEAVRGVHHRPIEIAAWFGVFVMGGLAGGFAGRTRGQEGEGIGLLAEANRVLSTLYRIARAMPRGLEVGAIASSVADELREALRAPAGMLLLSDFGTWTVAGSFGVSRPERLAGTQEETGVHLLARGGPVAIPLAALPPRVAEVFGEYDCLFAAPLARGGRPSGLILCACPSSAHHDRTGTFLRELAEETAVSVENARLFARVREMSVDEERRRLAAELHDGVAQALTHLRLELDFAARYETAEDSAARDAISRLSAVVDRAAGDVREMIGTLRSPVSRDGLAGSLRACLDDLAQAGGAEITFDALGSARAQPEAEAVLFHIARDSVAAAVRRPGTRRVRVLLSAGEKSVRLAIEGTGVSEDGALGPVRERAALIGARVFTSELPGGATRIEIVCPEAGERR